MKIIHFFHRDEKEVAIDGDTLNPQDITPLEKLRREGRKELKVIFSLQVLPDSFSKAVYDELDRKYPTKDLERIDSTQTVYVSKGGKLRRTNYEEHGEPSVVDTFYISVNELTNLLKRVSNDL